MPPATNHIHQAPAKLIARNTVEVRLWNAVNQPAITKKFPYTPNRALTVWSLQNVGHASLRKENSENQTLDDKWKPPALSQEMLISIVQVLVDAPAIPQGKTERKTRISYRKQTLDWLRLSKLELGPLRLMHTQENKITVVILRKSVITTLSLSTMSHSIFLINHPLISTCYKSSYKVNEMILNSAGSNTFDSFSTLLYSGFHLQTILWVTQTMCKNG